MACFKSEAGGSLSLWIVNDMLTPVHDMATWELATFGGDILYSKEVAYSVNGNVAQSIARIPASLLSQAQHKSSFMSVRSGRHALPDNRYFFVEIKDLLLPQANLAVEATSPEKHIEVRIKTDAYAYFVKVEVLIQGARFSDYYFDLLPQQDRVIQVWNVVGNELTLNDVTVSCMRAARIIN